MSAETNITFRPATPEDTIVVSEILSDAKDIKLANGDTAWDRRNFTTGEAEAFIADGGMYIGELDGAPMSTIILKANDTRNWGAQGTDGTALYIHKLARRRGHKGVGPEAVAFAEAIAHKAGKTALRLDNPAELDTYYEGLGFQAVDTRDFGDYKPTLREKLLDQSPAE